MVVQIMLHLLDLIIRHGKSDQINGNHTNNIPNLEMFFGMLNRTSNLFRVLCLLQTDCVLRKISSLPGCNANYLSVHYITTSTTSIKIQSQSRNLTTLNPLMHKLSQN